LISIGGTPNPVIFSIKQHAADEVVFFVSRDSRPLVSRDILPALLKDTGSVPDHEFVLTPDPQDLGECVFTLLREVPEALRRLGIDHLEWPELVDYTAGTKVMSAALTLASSRYPCQVAYIGTPDEGGRTKDGVGVVLDGRERVFFQENPWNRIAWFDARTAAELFNRGQYGNAWRLMERIARQVTEEGTKRVFKVLAGIFQGFACWDVFDHKQAQHLLNRHLQSLLDVVHRQTPGIPRLDSFAEEVRELHAVLNRIKPKTLTLDLVDDLLANALRRAELEQKYEDATARCYAAIERLAQHQLMLKYGIDASDARAELLPVCLRGEYEKRYTVIRVKKDGSKTTKMKLPLYADFRLLAERGDPIGKRFFECEERIQSDLQARNRSILGHGMEPIQGDQFRALFEDALYLRGIEESSLWRFPTLRL